VEEYLLYTLGHPEYYETLSNLQIQSTYLNSLKALLPQEWIIRRFDIWLQANPHQHTIKPQGFKIHLSSSLSYGETMIQRFVPICIRNDVQFKIAADPKIHRFLNSKRFPRHSSGKFATIYPQDEASFLSLLEALHHATTDLEGPYILSDKRYRDSKVVFYRYGGFQRIEEMRIDGMRRMMIRKSDGTLIPDERLPFFHLPEGIIDPVDADMDGSVDKEGSLLNDRYSVEEALSFSATGGVYRAIDQTNGSEVVIKEARPHTVNIAGPESQRCAIELLHHEYASLQRLRNLTCVPKIVDLFEEWEHTFLVESYFNGITLAEFRAHEDFIIMTKMDDQATLGLSCAIWRDICLRLLESIKAIHANGVIIGDLSPVNVLRNKDTGEVILIDFESAILADGNEDTLRFGARWFFPGFRRPEKQLSPSLGEDDDFYACGMVLYNLICPAQSMFELDKTHPRFQILDHFVEAGLPEDMRRIIRVLCDGDAEQAWHIAEEWDPMKW
jgi:hypothetical protein